MMCAADNRRRPVTGVILAGGQSRRFDYVNKAFFEIGGETIVERVYRVLRSVFDENIIVVTNNPADYLKWDVRITTDIFSCRSSMTGVHAGLFMAETPFIFVCGCDTPFLRRELIETVLAGAGEKIDAVVPRKSNGWFEPLCAVYSQACLQPLERCLRQQAFDIMRIFKEVRVKYLDEEVLRRADPALASFFNINTPEDLRLAREIAGREQQESGLK
jgi:molybdopterin-guanine dinucleotide biosynthesis protein A